MASDKDNWANVPPRGPSLGSILGGLYTWFALMCLMVAAWLTHVYVCLKEEHWGFLISGAIFFPIAIVHGVLIWLGIVH